MERRELREQVQEAEKQVTAEPSPSVSRGDLGWEGPVVSAATYLLGFMLRRWKAGRKRSSAAA
jgi:hypothetical protein